MDPDEIRALLSFGCRILARWVIVQDAGDYQFVREGEDFFRVYDRAVGVLAVYDLTQDVEGQMAEKNPLRLPERAKR